MGNRKGMELYDICLPRATGNFSLGSRPPRNIISKEKKTKEFPLESNFNLEPEMVYDQLKRLEVLIIAGR